MVFPAPPGAPGLSQPSSCCTPATLQVAWDFLSTIDCTTQIPEGPGTLTRISPTHYSGSGGGAPHDTYTVDLVFSSPNWVMTVTCQTCGGCYSPPGGGGSYPPIFTTQSPTLQGLYADASMSGDPACNYGCPCCGIRKFSSITVS